MFKLINKCKNDKGFTLTELIVSLTILGLFLGLFAMLIPFVYNNYQRVEYRWQLQDESIIVMKQIESASTGIKSSAAADLFYDESYSIIKGFDVSLISDENMIITKVDDDNLKYTYFFTVPDQKNPENSFIWKGQAIKPDDNGNNYVFKRISTIPMAVGFDIPLRPINKVKVSGQWVDGTQELIYLKNTVSVTIKGSGTFPGDYKLNKNVSLDNMFHNQKLNYTDGKPTNNLIAGWTNASANANTENIENEIPVNLASYPKATQDGNIIRFISINNYYTDLQTIKDEDIARGDNLGICATESAMMNSSLNSEVLASLRNFRDNTLKGNPVGDKIIEFYYNDWSPTWLKAMDKHPELESLYRVIIIPIAEIVK